jgi:hypothetical protein
MHALDALFLFAPRGETQKTWQFTRGDQEEPYGHFTLDWCHSAGKAGCLAYQVRRVIHRPQGRDVTATGVKVQTEINIS